MDDRQLIREMIATGNVNTLFQPVVSIPTKSILGFEAFSEGVCGQDRLAGCRLFSEDSPAELRLALDRLCREKALKNFRPIVEKHPNIMLFLNLDLAVLSLNEAVVDYFADQAARIGIPPDRIVIEAPIHMLMSVSTEVEDYYRKKKGFLVSADNVGVSDPFFELFYRRSVDFIKINRSFFAMGDDRSGRMLKRLVKLAGEMGSSVVAQCVETEEESVFLLKSGVVLQQGYFYTKDGQRQGGGKDGDPVKLFFGKIKDTYAKYLALRRENIRDRRVRFEALNRTAVRFAGKLAEVDTSDYEQTVRQLVADHEVLISAFVVDENGIQITTRPRIKGLGAKAARMPEAFPGFDHGGRDYFLYIQMGYEKFVTSPFDSFELGIPACLMAMPFMGIDNHRYVLCLEFPHPG